MKKTGLYLLFSFLIAWLIWGGLALAGDALSGSVAAAGIAQAVTALSMWAPAAGLFLAKKLTGGGRVLYYSMRPKLRGNIRWYLAAVLVPLAAAALGGVVYFLVFPSSFDPTLSALSQMIAPAMGGTNPLGDALLPVLLITQLFSGLTIGPLINMFFAFGEEVGWRGFLYPALRQKLSPFAAHLAVGAIWGLWHTPINMMGHNYGIGYWGYPWVGILAMCFFTFGGGVFLSWLTTKTGSVWPAALGHGAINALAALPSIFMAAGAAPYAPLGPALSGILPAVPLVVFALVLALRENRAAPPPPALPEDAPAYIPPPEYTQES